MCYNVIVLEKRAMDYYERYKDVMDAAFDNDMDVELPVYYHATGFTYPELPIVRNDGIYFYEWGLIPHWVKDKKTANEIRVMTLNAVGETVYEKPSFKYSIATRRCLLGVNGFYESRDVKKVKYPYLIRLKEDGLFSLGCIYTDWVDSETGEVKSTFSILTTPANPMMEKIHNLKKRMPLIIDRADEKKWVDPKLSKEEIMSLIKPYDEKKMMAYTVSKEANNARVHRNKPEIMEEVMYAELEGV